MSRLLFAGTARSSDEVGQRLAVDGRMRTYRVRIPRHATPESALPVVLVLHGDKSSASRIRRVSRFDDTADARGFLAVYPNGTGWMDVPLRSWNAGTCCGYAMNAQVDDVAFFRALLDDVAHRYPMDPRRVYVTGMSNGGMMAYRLACEMSDRVAAVATVAGAMTSSPCSPSGPMSVMMVHGTDDAYVPYRGGRSRFTGDERSDPSVDDALAFWARHNGCPSTPDLTRVEPPGQARGSTSSSFDSAFGLAQDDPSIRWGRHPERGAPGQGRGPSRGVGRIVRTRYAECREGTEVLLYTIEGGRHRWPGRHADKTELPATDLIWEFFSHHAKP